MKTWGIRKIATGALCAGLLAFAGIASAGDWGHHGRYIGVAHRIVGGGPRYGFGVGISIGTPIYPTNVYVDPYCEPLTVGPVLEPAVVIGGGGYYGGAYYHRGGYYHGGGYVRGGYGHGRRG